jgi:hypothetical protein
MIFLAYLRDVAALADTERLQFPVQRRTFHANKLGGARNIS